MKLAVTALALSLGVSTAFASSCTPGNALAWPFPASNGSTDDGCNGDIECEEIAQIGQCNSVGGSACDDGSDDSSDDLISDSGDDEGLIKRAVDLECTSEETCYLYTDGSVLCLDIATGEYHDDVGGSGNADTGVYTSADGEVITGTGSATAGTATATATGSLTSGTRTSTVHTQTTTGTSTQSTVGATTPGSRSTSASPSASAAAAQTGSASYDGAGARNALLALAPMPLFLAIL